MQRVCVVVVTWNGAHLLPACLEGLRAQSCPHELVVVDNASTDGTAALLARDHPEARVVALPANLGFAGGVQAGIDAAGSETVALLNNDAVPEPGWLAALLAVLDAEPDVAAVTSRMLLAADGRINNAGGALTSAGVGYDRGLGEADGPPYDLDADVSCFSGGAALLRADRLRAVGGFPREFFLYYEDTDVSWRLRRSGARIRYAASAVVHHEHAASTDARSELFAFHNQRNQLLTLLRNAPAGVAVRAVLRFAAITVLRLVRRGESWTQRPGHRLRVLAAVLRLLPATLRQRRAIDRAAVVSRRSDARAWLGTPARY